ILLFLCSVRPTALQCGASAVRFSPARFEAVHIPPDSRLSLLTPDTQKSDPSLFANAEQIISTLPHRPVSDRPEPAASYCQALSRSGSLSPQSCRLRQQPPPVFPAHHRPL